MLEEAQGPVNFTMLLTLFGDRLNGTDEENVILNAWKNFDKEGTGFINQKRFAKKKASLLNNNFVRLCLLVYEKFLLAKDVPMIVSRLPILFERSC